MEAGSAEGAAGVRQALSWKPRLGPRLAKREAVGIFVAPCGTVGSALQGPLPLRIHSGSPQSSAQHRLQAPSRHRHKNVPKVAPLSGCHRSAAKALGSRDLRQL
ncbi:hypothetical protein NDU88_005828 [Pleurodeles waltl]|uniref:Uncharacterized protein n=1 Tax=Pleurodeles waltl TaxID=8319 RepID=A0AAV7RKT0_PLEWA|nr:hypothetical protein NDU88_005828 [Pleurodeles waltl]